LNFEKHSLKVQSGTKSPVKPTWSEKMAVLSTFLEFTLNFLSIKLEKQYKIWNSPEEKRCQNLNFEKHSLKVQSGTNSPVKPTWSEKMAVLSTFLKPSLNFLFDDIKKHYEIKYSQEQKQC